MFGEFDERSMLCQTLTSQILAYKWYPYGRNLSIHQIFLLTTFNLAVQQTLMLYGTVSFYYSIYHV